MRVVSVTDIESTPTADIKFDGKAQVMIAQVCESVTNTRNAIYRAAFKKGYSLGYKDASK